MAETMRGGDSTSHLTNFRCPRKKYQLKWLLGTFSVHVHVHSVQGDNLLFALVPTITVPSSALAERVFRPDLSSILLMRTRETLPRRRKHC